LHSTADSRDAIKWLSQVQLEAAATAAAAEVEAAARNEWRVWTAAQTGGPHGQRPQHPEQDTRLAITSKLYMEQAIDLSQTNSTAWNRLLAYNKLPQGIRL
jgi:hypothetical protein